MEMLIRTDGNFIRRTIRIELCCKGIIYYTQLGSDQGLDSVESWEGRQARGFSSIPD